jgi:hypothetical protein
MRILTALMLGGTLAIVGCGSDSSSGGGGGGTGSTPTITMVAWEATADCMTNVRSDVVITVTATDGDTSAADLIYRVDVSGCGGPIGAAVSTVSCPNVAEYPGTVIVSDPDGNNSTPVTFPVPVCDSGNCADDPGCSL